MLVGASEWGQQNAIKVLWTKFACTVANKSEQEFRFFLHCRPAFPVAMTVSDGGASAMKIRLIYPYKELIQSKYRDDQMIIGDICNYELD